MLRQLHALRGAGLLGSPWQPGGPHSTAPPLLCSRLVDLQDFWPLPPHHRPHTTSAQGSPGGEVAQPLEGAVTYEGPLSSTLRRLKLLSLFSASAALVGSPLMLALDSGATASLGGKAALAVVLSGFGVSTTALLHWFTGPYVHSLRYDPRDDTVDMTTLGLLARPQRTRCRVGEARYADTSRPQVTFKARGRYFYLDPDRFPDLDLLCRLTPPEPGP